MVDSYITRRCVSLINTSVVLSFLSHFVTIIFNFIHVSSVVGNIDDYKILYRIRFRLFWPRMRSNIKEWIQKYPHCILTYRWIRCCQGLMFSWPVSSPFAILQIDLWSPGHQTDRNSNFF